MLVFQEGAALMWSKGLRPFYLASLQIWQAMKQVVEFTQILKPALWVNFLVLEEDAGDMTTGFLTGYQLAFRCG